jgi:hypothetical protein
MWYITRPSWNNGYLIQPGIIIHKMDYLYTVLKFIIGGA